MIKRGNTKRSKKHAGRSIRKRGNNYEVRIAKQFREMGWLRCKTSRSESKNLDAMGIDLVFTDPFNIQCKCRNNFASPVNDLVVMPQNENYNVIFQKIPHRGEYVIMEKKDFYELIKMLKFNKII